MATSLMPTTIFGMKPTKDLTSFDRKVASKVFPLSSNTLLSCSALTCDEANSNRRSANYKPPIWDFDFIQSLNNQYTDATYATRACELKEQVKTMLEDGDMWGVDRLELIDDLQKMGICYHFEDEIRKILTCIWETRYAKKKEIGDLFSTALEFRLLRQHGFFVSQDIFDRFKNERGEFESRHEEDTKGLLQLYEASHLLTEGEETLEAAREFATFFLNRNLEEGTVGIEENLSLLVRRSLEMPLHWRVQRLNARWSIEEYGRRPDPNPILLEFAKLDFNIIQAAHQQELKHASRWWKRTGLAENLPFARDRLVECYFWNIGWLFGPKNGYSRLTLAKVNSLITVLDDIFDVYATLEELQLLNDVLQRWNIEEMDQLPTYMQMCYLALNNLVDDTAYHVLKEQGLPTVPYLRKLWKDLSHAYLQEAKWYSEAYTPTLEEYMNNAWISISTPVMLGFAFILTTNSLHMEDISNFLNYHDVIRWSATFVRIADDLGTSKDELERGDVPKSIQCSMNHSDESKEAAEEHVRGLIRRTWKKMNRELQATDSVFSGKFMKSAADLGRMAMYMYQHGDGHGHQNLQIRKRISSLLFEPIP
ncbi:terpene synthase 10-like [Dorcoceras hygrometricum]|uniref:Terpene synthase 10-like n=1 Tax=Dorcoceras hygrometricum TaxID=472368 RepID=A0A2Z7BSX9_9LAMI|nr:terpene synthase 10-like [Dorcoceras hygrometricum]